MHNCITRAYRNWTRDWATSSIIFQQISTLDILLKKMLQSDQGCKSSKETLLNYKQSITRVWQQNRNLHKNLPDIDSAEPKHNEKVARRFTNAAAFCMSCCLSSHSMILRASANTSPWSLYDKNKHNRHETTAKCQPLTRKANRKCTKKLELKYLFNRTNNGDIRRFCTERKRTDNEKLNLVYITKHLLKCKGCI